MAAILFFDKTSKFEVNWKMPDLQMKPKKTVKTNFYSYCIEFLNLHYFSHNFSSSKQFTISNDACNEQKNIVNTVKIHFMCF